MAETFDQKSFNAEAFGYLVGHIPNLRGDEIRRSKALAGDPDIRRMLSAQDGTGYVRTALKGLLDGEAVNYDGQTDITATSTKTYERGVVVVGRAKAWTERDFSCDITGGQDFMGSVAAQVSEYQRALDQETILSVLAGIFAMTGEKNAEFVEKHTCDVTGEKHPDLPDGCVNGATLNIACNKACGANKKRFTLVFMHSDVATHLENLNLLEYLKYTDPQGVTRDLGLGTWNGKLVVIDDSLPLESGYYAASEGDEGARKIVAEGASDPNEINLADVQKGDFFPQGVAAGQYVAAGNRYTTYVMGRGAITYEDIGAKVPFEMARDPKTNGGLDTLYMRQRKVFAPYGISYERKSQLTLSPTDEELRDGQNWALAHSMETREEERSYINHKAIPIARILSRG